MGKAQGTVHTVTVRVGRVQTQGSRDAINSRFGLAEPNSDPTAKKPNPGQVGVECYSPIRQGFALIVVANDKGEGEACAAKSNRVILA
jgi:hypothetical protein